MNKEFRKVKLISKNVLESIAYYSGFNPLYIGITFPGGHVERSESFVDAVIREVEEETGLTISKPNSVVSKIGMMIQIIAMLSSFTKLNTLLVSSNLQTKEKSGGRILKIYLILN